MMTAQLGGGANAALGVARGPVTVGGRRVLGTTAAMEDVSDDDEHSTELVGSTVVGICSLKKKSATVPFRRAPRKHMRLMPA